MDWIAKHAQEYKPDTFDLYNPARILKSIMQNQGVTVKELAEMSGIHHNTIQKWMTRHIQPSYHNYLACLNALGYTVEVKKSP